MASLEKAVRAPALSTQKEDSRSPEKALRLFLFGGMGYASVLLGALIKAGYNVVGLCASDGEASWTGALKNDLARRLMRLGLYDKQCFIYEDPFDEFERPARIARGHGIPVAASENLKSEEFRRRFAALSPDLAILSGFPRLVPKSVFELPRIATINFHPSLLPRHRGGTPSRWVVRNGETETGITAHHVTEKFDSGEIIAQRRISVGADSTWGDVEQRICGELPHFGLEVIGRAAAGDIRGVPQNEAQASYEPPFRGVHQIIDWRVDAGSIQRICNAIRPKSGGFAFMGGRQYCIWSVKIAPPQIDTRTPGEIVGYDGAGCPIVSCGRGAICIEAFLEKGRIVKARWLANVRGFAQGQVFGQPDGQNRTDV